MNPKSALRGLLLAAIILDLIVVLVYLAKWLFLPEDSPLYPRTVSSIQAWGFPLVGMVVVWMFTSERKGWWY